MTIPNNCERSLTITIDCGCRITLVSEGDQHRPDAPRPCPRHMFIVAPLLVQLLTTRVRVDVVDEKVTR